jgi:nitroreductase
MQKARMRNIWSTFASLLILACLVTECSKKAAAAGDETAKPLSSIDFSKYAGASKYANQNGVFGRLSSRNFSNVPVTDKEKELLLNAAFSVPTGGNEHSTELMVVTDRKLMKIIQEGHPYSKALDTAPLVIVLGANTKTAKYPELLTLDAGIAAMAIMTQAAEMGLQSIPMSIEPQPERIQAVGKALGNPPEVIPQIMVAIGHSAVDADTHASTNYYNARQVHTNGW